MDMQELARLGAITRLQQVEMERQELEAFINGNGNGTREIVTLADTPATRDRRTTPVFRKDVSERMKRYWADRKAGRR